MSSWSFEENRLLFSPFIACSGMFTANYDVLTLYPTQAESLPAQPDQLTTLFNPMPPSVQHQVTDSVRLGQQESFLLEYQKAQKHKLFDRSNFDDYAQVLFGRLIPNLVRQNHDIFIFPLRGCRQPGILVKVIADLPEERMVIFNYTYATRDSQQPLIESQLAEQLKARIPEKSSVSIGVVDTAKGGYGSKHLAKLLARQHRTLFDKQHWSVQFHLLHERDRDPKLSHEIPKHGSDRLAFLWPHFYEVESLLVEDWSEGIGLAVEGAGNYFELKRCVEEGRILYRDEETVRLIESKSLCDTMTSLAVDAVNQTMLTSPEIVYVTDVWNREPAIESHAGKD